MVFLLLLPSSLRSPIGRGGLVGKDEVSSGFMARPALLPNVCTVTINPMPFLVLLEFRRVYSCRFSFVSLLFLCRWCIPLPPLQLSFKFDELS